KDKSKGVSAPMKTRSSAGKRPGTSSTSEPKSKRQRLLSVSVEDKNDLERFLNTIGTKIGNKYNNLGIHLGLDKSDIENIERSSPNDAERWGYEVITKWKQMNPHKLPSLADALRKTRRVDLAIEVDEYIKHHLILQSEDTGNLYPVKIEEKGLDVRNTNITDNVTEFMKTEDLRRCLDHMKKHNLVILTGMSGVGKTEIAKNYWKTERAKYDIGWLISSKSDNELRTSILQFKEILDANKVQVDLSQDLPMSKILEKINLEIRSDSKRGNDKIKYLLIFDDVKEEITHQAIVEGFPSKQNIAVIITTQQSHHLVNSALELKGFTKREALDLLSGLKDSDDIKIELWEAMSHLPSALRCAAYDIKKTGRDVKHYIKGIQNKNEYKNIEQRTLKLMGISYDGKTPIQAHVSNAKNMLEELQKEDGEPLCFVLKTMGFFNSKDIPEFILRDILRQKNIDNDGSVIGDSDIDFTIDHLVTKMQARSYVTISPNETHGHCVDTHELVQLGIRHAMEEKDQQSVLEILMCVLLRYFAKDTRYMKYFSRNTHLMPHVETVLDHCEKLGFLNVSFDMK
ncbi:unnamed protein product, partial [Owenia fusiformis]